MNLGKRLIACLLVMMLVCGMITVSSAAVATPGIYFCGVRTAKSPSGKRWKRNGKFFSARTDILLSHLFFIM